MRDRQDHAVAHGPWSPEALELPRAWDPLWAADAERMTRAAWQAGGLSPRIAALVALAVASACTALDADGTRRHIRAALAHGATAAEAMAVLQIGVAQGAQACNIGVPILAEELAAFERNGGVGA